MLDDGSGEEDQEGQEGQEVSGAEGDSRAAVRDSTGAEARGAKRRRRKPPPLPAAHTAPDGRQLSQLMPAEAAALLEVGTKSSAGSLWLRDLSTVS